MRATAADLLADIAQAIATIAAARAHAGKSTDMLDPAAADDLARNLAQGIVGWIDRAGDQCEIDPS